MIGLRTKNSNDAIRALFDAAERRLSDFQGGERT